MPKINLLSQETAELIAAGEVVERPASVIKELVENSIDAGARHITVEIQRGGILYMRVTDDGCGIAPEDVPIAFLRHATSKIGKSDDLDSISTLGFRGEALAAAAAVSRVEMLTKTADSDLGTRYLIEGGVEILQDEAGCADGTTIIIRDIFYNTPARMKFLKKDVSEGNSVAAFVERAALSHPEIAFKLIREGRQTVSSVGDGKLSSAIYGVLGREFSKGLIPVSGGTEPIRVEGFTCKPITCRQSRAGQYTFLNGRLVKSGTVTAAVEQAYKNSAMVGKFPAFVLNISLPFDMVDVNVHPAKTEVRFADERRIFEAVHYAVKSAVSAGDSRPVIDMSAAKKRADAFNKIHLPEYRNIPLTPERTVVEKAYNIKPSEPMRLREDTVPYFLRNDIKRYIEKNEVTRSEISDTMPAVPTQFTENGPPATDISRKTETKITVPEHTEIADESETENPMTLGASPKPDEPPLRYIGEAFMTYIVVEKGDSIFLIDKHAAHERIIYNRMKQGCNVETQALLAPVTVRLGRDEYTAAVENIPLLVSAGFEVEDFGNFTLIVRAVPATLEGEDTASVITEACGSLCERGTVELDRLERIYHTVACRAAVKAGNRSAAEELSELARRVLSDREVMYCPHGRPVAFEIKRRDLERQFGRIQ